MKRLAAWAAREPIIAAVVVLYVMGFAIAPVKTVRAVQTGLGSLISVLPIILAVFSALGLIGIVLDRQRIGSRLGEKFGFGTIALTLGFGVLLVGPVFAVYPLLRTFREHGARWSVVVGVITASGAKLPFMPLEIASLGWKFALLRFTLTLAAAVLTGLAFDRLMAAEATLDPAPSTE